MQRRSFPRIVAHGLERVLGASNKIMTLSTNRLRSASEPVKDDEQFMNHASLLRFSWHEIIELAWVVGRAVQYIPGKKWRQEIFSFLVTFESWTDLNLV